MDEYLFHPTIYIYIYGVVGVREFVYVYLFVYPDPRHKQDVTLGHFFRCV